MRIFAAHYPLSEPPEVMIPLKLRAVLICACVFGLFYIIYKIRKSKFNISDSIFWIISAILLLLLAIFPSIAVFISNFLGMQSPTNFILIVIIAITILKMFLMSVHISQLNEKIKRLAQNAAFEELKNSARK